MPAVSEKQRRFMAMAHSVTGRKKLKSEGKKVPPMKVAAEFMKSKKK